MIRPDFVPTLNRLFGDISNNKPVQATEDELVYFLSSQDAEEQQLLCDLAAQTRDYHCGKRMVVRGLVEFSSYCTNTCFYCGLNRDNTRADRFQLSPQEILSSADLVHQAGINTIVLQSGEDGMQAELLADIIRQIKHRYDMAITLSVGERENDEYKIWKEAGADRYLLRVESTDPELYRSLHRGRELASRLACLESLQNLGYQTGSGMMVGPPGQTLIHLARDIQFLYSREFDMIGVGPFIPHPHTRLKDSPAGSVHLTLRVVALLRLTTRNAWLPATTALGSMDKDYRVEALKAGANVLMPNFSPVDAKKKYEIYPGKRCVTEKAGACAGCTEGIAHAAGLETDWTRADSLKRRGEG